MAKHKAQFEMTSYGLYEGWDNNSKELPSIRNFTTKIPATLDVEFGFILEVKKGKGLRLDFTIYHPNIPDKKGNVMEPFSGDVYVRNNNWEFYLGDTLWAPIDDKVGDWRMVIECDGKIVAEKTFTVLEEYADGEIQFWKKRGY
ncbi:MULTISPECIES: DUF3859 domain-containing protein [Alteromonadaceae]|uniref:DUF3859 domain-containing protein n=1 Tax=Alteromonadaceae TaxID=72275 RepID=UPI001C0952C9|nr:MULTISPECIES: DUF3859 domain-containing protein [Aliiglaciecola]MBU2880061.1 DUF3859 domain-containing protein [Aliiglaciecola lipolytica]MDO6710941.1 DUF3859 domain-containing protein [Aliiglaciecola sp. 2_MG-2023]MDO6752422.1 DUF3859 domain-containing protein [Aliiglaciecola sp. 1_MG-2023]